MRRIDRAIQRGEVPPDLCFIDGEPFALSRLSKKDVERIGRRHDGDGWNHVDFSRATNPPLDVPYPVKQAMGNFLRRRMDEQTAKTADLSAIPEGGIPAPSSRELRERVGRDPRYSEKDFLNDRADRESVMHDAQKHFRARQAKWRELPGFKLPVKGEPGRIYRGHNVMYRPETDEALRALWGRVVRDTPELAVALKTTAFPAELDHLIFEELDFQFRGIWVRSTILLDGRVFFTAPEGAEPEVVWPKAATVRGPSPSPAPAKTAGELLLEKLKLPAEEELSLSSLRRWYQIRRHENTGDPGAVRALDQIFRGWLESELFEALAVTDPAAIPAEYEHAMQAGHGRFAPDGERELVRDLFQLWNRTSSTARSVR